MGDLLPLLDELGPHPIVLGHSYGGLIAWELARAAPERIAELILVDPAIAISAEVARVNVEQFSTVGRRWPDHRAAFEELAAARPADGHWSAALDVALATDRDADGWLRPMISAEAVRSGFQQMRQPLAPTEFRGATLLLEAGRENGLYTSQAVVTQMRAQLGDALTHVVLDATHTIPSDFPDLLAAEVASFVQRTVD
jgi:lipase